MMVEDRAGRGSQALQAAAYAMMGAAAQTPGLFAGVLAVRERRRRSSISTSTAPRRSCSASTFRTCSRRCRSISARPTSTTSTCSAAPSASWRRRGSDYRSDTKDMLNIRVRNTSGDTVPLGAFTTVREPIRPLPRAALQSLSGRRARRRGGARLQPGPGDPDHGAARGRDCCRRASATNGRRSPSSRLRAGNTAIFAFVLAVVFVFLVLAAQFESLTLPLAVILIVPMCLIASIVGVVLRGQDNNILDAGRLHRADRPGRQERHPDRRIRQAARGPRQRPLRRRGRGRAFAASGRS